MLIDESYDYVRGPENSFRTSACGAKHEKESRANQALNPKDVGDNQKIFYLNNKRKRLMDGEDG